MEVSDPEHGGPDCPYKKKYKYKNKYGGYKKYGGGYKKKYGGYKKYDDYVDNAEAVIDLLAERKALMQRPVVVKGDRAIIGRPKDRVGEFLDS